jgi:hypothetical protein
MGHELDDIDRITVPPAGEVDPAPAKMATHWHKLKKLAKDVCIRCEQAVCREIAGKPMPLETSGQPACLGLPFEECKFKLLSLEQPSRTQSCDASAQYDDHAIHTFPIEGSICVCSGVLRTSGTLIPWLVSI